MTECQGLKGPPGPTAVKYLRLLRKGKLTDVEFKLLLRMIRDMEAKKDKYEAVVLAARDAYREAPSSRTAAPWEHLKETLDDLE